MFSPLAYTKTYAMAAAAVLSITLVPVLMGYFIRGKVLPEQRNPVNRFLVGAYMPLLQNVLRYPKTYWRALRRARAAGVYPFHACPRSMDEKFLWRKIFDRDPCFSRISDKLALRGWLQDSGLDLSMAPVLWAGFSPHALPDEFLTGDVVIKANHDCGTCFMMWRDALPRDILTTKLECALARDYSQYAGEWGYKNIVPRVFAEKRIGRDGVAVNDLKFYTFGRRIERIVHIQDQQGGRFGQVFVPDGEGGFDRLNRAPTVCDGMIDVPLEGVFDRALSLACELGAPFDHMRVDLLEADGELFMTEMTVYNQSGYLTEGGADRNSNVSLAWDIRRSWALRTGPRLPMMPASETSALR